MFSDIVGYTALMGSDEKKAFDTLKKNRRIHWRLIKKYRGRFLKEMGDGTLASFSSSMDAVLCAISIQIAAKEMDIPLRIGIHQGDVVFEQKDVLGDGVNIASRIQGNSEVGCVSISETVFQDIENKVGLKTEYLGEKALKGVPNPIGIYKVSLKDESLLDYQVDTGELIKPLEKLKKTIIGVFILAFILIAGYLFVIDTNRGSKNEVKHGLAIKPIQNSSNDTSQTYFRNGLTQSIISVLANIKQLSIPTLSSVIRIDTAEAKQAGQILNVDYILAGYLRKDTNKDFITFNLVDTRTGHYAQVFEYPGGENHTLELPELLAKDISKFLDLKLSAEELNRIERKPTDKFSAYEYYLRAMHEDKKYNAEGHLNAIKYLNKALEVDPEYSEAYSLLARQYINLSVAHTKLSTDEALKLALPAAQHAVKYDSSSSDAYIVLAGVNYYFQWDFIEAENNFLKALDLNSWGEAPIYNCICMPMEFFIVNSVPKDALRLIDNVRDTDPTYVLGYGMESMIYLNELDFDKALLSIRKQSILMDSWLIPMLHGIIYYYMDDYNSALDKFQFGLSLTTERPGKLLARIAAANHKLGNGFKTDLLLHELIERHENGDFGLGIPIANLYNEMGDEENTFKWLDIAYNNRESNFLFLKYVDFRNIRQHPRYLDLLRKYGFEV